MGSHGVSPAVVSAHRQGEPRKPTRVSKNWTKERETIDFVVPRWPLDSEVMAQALLYPGGQIRKFFPQLRQLLNEVTRRFANGE